MTADGGMFVPLSDEERASATEAGQCNADAFKVVIPIPDDAPEPNWSTLRPTGADGDPANVWIYRTAVGGRAFLVARWDKSNDGKEIRPLTWNGCRWQSRAMPNPRPLYKLPELVSESDQPVLIVEGEKCADAAATVFPDHVTTTWAGGSGMWHETDWSLLAGREVLLVADADEPGRKAVNDIANILAELNCTVRVALPPDAEGIDGRTGRDIVDVLAESDADTARHWVESLAVDASSENNGATGAPKDWQDALLERSATDPGAPFESKMVRELADLQRQQPAGWERLRARFRETSVRVGELDKVISQEERNASCDSLQGRPVEWNDPEPWSHAVDGCALLSEIAKTIRAHVSMTTGLADAVALWIVHTYVHHRLEISTFLSVTSATKRCGKSTLMEIAGELVWRYLPVSGSITTAALFRIIERDCPTLMLDEMDSQLRNAPELRGVINGSQRRTQARVLRTVGDDHEPCQFVTFCPKAFAGIGDLPDTVLDRSLVIKLRRRGIGSDELARWRDRDRTAIAAIKPKLVRWMEDNGDRILAHRDQVAFPPGLDDRARDAWEALFAIADIAGGDWPERARRACQAVRANTEDETGAREQLLADLWQVFRDAGDPPAMPTGKHGESCGNAIIPALCAMEHRPWSEWGGKPLTPRGLATLLKPFEIRPGTIRLADGSTPKGYKREALESLWRQYLPAEKGSLSATAPQPASSKGLRDFPSATGAQSVADTKTRNTASDMTCGVVADESSVIVKRTATDGDPCPLEDSFADGNEWAAIFEHDGKMSQAAAEGLAEREYELEPGTLASGRTQP